MHPFIEMGKNAELCRLCLNSGDKHADATRNTEAMLEREDSNIVIQPTKRGNTRRRSFQCADLEAQYLKGLDKAICNVCYTECYIKDFFTF